MAKFHFVEDYEQFVRQLMRDLPLDEAMSRAVGGDYDRIGAVECEILKHFGLKDGDSVVDFGRGSGRLAVNLAKETRITYLGLDVVQDLLNYAKTKCPNSYRFVKNNQLSLPVADDSVDLFAAFSIFTHLLHTECYIYLEEMYRALRPGGRVVASFLEFSTPSHWGIFTTTVGEQRTSSVPHLNTFIERSVWEIWAGHLGFEIAQFVDGPAAPWPSGTMLGQSVVVLSKPPVR
ncbi:2-methoxy-6-polyprenyl-1,4-benzoquinol methylase, mitochondrial [Methylobacterium tardum]|uniref:Methyltransferase domain-containing protein n=1 Tax=Methylobacterium tardum TaxID=374432 RepID=A0AA37TGZ4_9HYPH|nr:methyltransferase domain-containing protein [Methylobacterium tardum]GJE50481.1 2-methoxy-6-polyprenyl-1,4-benzoquinol methylase, mitochondrial [Methylobacterium tardum]GLS71902.1 hypothetical protein GCM10007890_39150 [Methylobacterium tardum]